MYIKVKNVKSRIKDLGYRSEKSAMVELDKKLLSLIDAACKEAKEDRVQTVRVEHILRV